MRFWISVFGSVQLQRRRHCACRHAGPFSPCLSVFCSEFGNSTSFFIMSTDPCTFVFISLRGLAFMWWRCYSLCLRQRERETSQTRGHGLRHKPTEPAHSFFFFYSRVYFCPYVPFNCISFHRTLCFLTLFFRSYPRLIGLFNYMSLYESLLQPWYNNPLWLSGLKNTN